ncbi:coiled-coil domain-containing protein [Paenibacillus solani]|uniref:coiled-coil domain-containing protein n=1 Tax=Paenibacillus solani TaxID=1705565 RepID=UPI003D2AAC75
MNVRVKYPILPFLLCMVLLFSFMTAPTAVYSQQDLSPMAPDSEEARKLLEDSLSIVEIDYEIERITKRMKELELLQSELQVRIQEMGLRIEDRRNRAGAVLRSYYMGERSQLFYMLLSAKNLAGFFRIMDFYDIIIQNDRDTLKAYNNQYRSLASAKAEAARNADQLIDVKDRLVKQRERVLALEQQVDGALSASSNPEAMKKLIEEFTLYWENVGLYEVKRHFQALANAMENLPQFVQGSKNILKTNGKVYTIDIHEDELNTFLRKENEIFNSFAFHFENGKVIASGESGNLSLLIEGKYTVINDPENAIMFQVDKLVFNRLELPDTTRTALQEEFDMSFYPKQLVSFLKATEVSSENQRLVVQMELDL